MIGNDENCYKGMSVRKEDHGVFDEDDKDEDEKETSGSLHLCARLMDWLYQIGRMRVWKIYLHQMSSERELRMLSRSLFDCKALTLNVRIQVSQFASNSQLFH